MKERASILENIKNNPQLDVLVIGGGVNGIGTFRELALQGVRVLLAEKDDYSGGASAASSHMLHGGIRYLENGEFRLVREALHERNRMLKNAPHYAKPLPTTIPIFKWFSGILNAPLKFLGILERPSERGAAVIKPGLMMYDWFTGSDQTMPYHDFRWKKASLEKYPALNREVVCTATYYDAWMPYPERICIDLLRDSMAASDEAMALNYFGAVDGDGGTVTLKDELTGETYDVQPKVVINAAGPWIDFVNRAMDQDTTFIGGTKGSHLILDNPDLFNACNGNEFFFENEDGRIVLIFPYMNRVMVGTTDIRIDDPDDAVCTDDEIEYILGMIPRVFPNVTVDRSQIVYTFSGVRPLPASGGGRTGAISRDHSIKTVEAGNGLDFRVHSLVGGKWTTFRAFSEQTADVALKDINATRQVDTKTLAIGGGKDYPTDEAAQNKWLSDLQQQTELPLEQLTTLFERYGTYAAEVATFMSAANDTALQHLPDYTQREIHFITQHEQTVHLDDFFKRRSLMAMLGYAKPEAIAEVADIMAEALDWSAEDKAAEIERMQRILDSKHPIPQPLQSA